MSSHKSYLDNPNSDDSKYIKKVIICTIKLYKIIYF